MKLYGIYVTLKDGRNISVLTKQVDLSSFGFFQRGSVEEFMTFFSRTLAERTALGQRQSVEEQAYICHVHARLDGLCGVLVADQEYPSRVAFSLLAKVLEDFTGKYPKDGWKGIGQRGGVPYAELATTLKRYQNPHEADSMMRIQGDLDETKVILHKTIESVLDRGEKIESIVERSDQLSAQSKMFYRQAKKTNSWCCTVM